MELSTQETVWAFDLGKGSIGEAVRQGTRFLHKESLLIPADFAETKTAANRRRMWRTRLAHKAREAWLDKVWRAAGLEPLGKREVWRNPQTRQWELKHPADYRLEREFAPRAGEQTQDGAPSDAAGASICYTSCLLRIKLLRGEKLEPWQIYKALWSSIQRRGYDPDIPWKTRQQRRTARAEEDEGATLTRMQEFEKRLAEMAPAQQQHRWPCYFDAWKMGLWDPARPDELKLRQDCQAQSTRDQIVPRKMVEQEVRALSDAAAKQVPALSGKGEFLLFGPSGKRYASFYPEERERHGLREGGATDWQGVLGQKIPRFDNRIIAKCVLIPRLNVCKIRKGADGDLHPNSRLAAEVVFLMKLKNMRFQQGGGVRGLTAAEIGQIFHDPKRTKLALTATQWKKWCLRLGGFPLPGQNEEVAEPRFSGRSRFCRPALQILHRLILSGHSPQAAYAEELARLNGNSAPLKGLVPDDLKFLLQMGQTWQGIYIPNQKLEALARATEEPQLAIQRLIGDQNDPVVRHRLMLFAQRLDELAEQFGTPDYVVLEFVREDFMGEQARRDYLKFQRDRARDRAEARAMAAKAGATARDAGLKMELHKAQSGICLYTGEALAPTSLDDYVIDHIVPRAKGGSDAAVNYVLTTRRANDDKADRTPYEWLAGKEGWDAYVERVRERGTTLRNKKVQLLTSPEAPALVDKYTALAETAWISKLAQTIVGLRFGWPGGISNGQRKVIVVSGGLTGRIRRKYGLNRLLNPDAESEEEAETKNRHDDRHHALDAMVISFIPNWARNARLAGSFRLPEGVHRELFEKEIAEVIPRNVALARPVLEETFYGRRTIRGRQYAVGREELSALAAKLVSGKRVLKKRGDIETLRIVDLRIRSDVEAFLEASPNLTLSAWDAWCKDYRLGPEGPAVQTVMVTKSKADSLDEYKDVSKDGSGQFRRGAKHRGYFLFEQPRATKSNPLNKQIQVRPVYVHESRKGVVAQINGKVLGYFESGCLVRLTKAWTFQGRGYTAGLYTLASIWANRNAKLRHPHFGEIGPVGLRILLDAGFHREE
ncbi:MAG TPA: HNH endonuclease domain-containing protein [Candidatus Acidoferrum sp.]|nr:HNH endonuclease domain-containing protein [Candidatus Acidoferrum sp.]